MPLSRPVQRFTDAVSSFLVSEDAALLEVLVSDELEPQAARLADSVAVERGDLIVSVMVEWTSADALYQAIIGELQQAIEAAAGALAAVDELPRFPWPEPSTSPRVPLGIHTVELAESFARASSNHVGRVVVAMAISGPESVRPQIAVAMHALVQSTGTPNLKWMLFGRTALLGERSVVCRRRLTGATERVAGRNVLTEFCQDAAARVLTLGSTSGWLRELTLPRRIGSSQLLAVRIEGIAYLDSRFYFTEAGRSLTQQCRELEAKTTGADHACPLYDEAHAPVLHDDAETHFAELCERIAVAMLADEASLLVVLAPDHSRAAPGLEQSALALGRAATSTRVRYVIEDPRLHSFTGSPAWRTQVAEYAIAIDEVEQGMRDRLEAPDCPVVEKLRYLTALASAALARDDPEAAQALSLQALELSSQANDRREITVAWYGLGNTLYQSGTFAHAEQAYAECVDRAVDERNDGMTAQGMTGLANTFFTRKDWSKAIHCYEISAKLFAKLGQAHGYAYALAWSAEAHMHMGGYQAALERFDRALAALDGVNPALAPEYSGQKAELLLRKSRLFGAAGMKADQAKLVSEAQLHGAIEHLADHP